MSDVVEIDGIEYEIRKIRVGDTAAFYLSEEVDNYFVAIVTAVLTPTRVHLRVFGPNDSGVRKRVDRCTDKRFLYRWLPISTAHTIEDNVT